MILPVQITFRNMPPSDAVAARVQEEAEKLDEFYRRITSCRVIVEIPHRHHALGEQFHVRIELGVPGGEIVVRQTRDQRIDRLGDRGALVSRDDGEVRVRGLVTRRAP